MKPKILWTVLPKGVSADGTKLGLSLLVSPRCETGSADPVSLGEFPAMVSWPQHQLQITLRFGNQSPVAATIVPPAPDLALWQALFPENGTSVNSYEEPAFLNEKIHSFPVLHVVDFLRRAYSAVGVASPTELPALGELEANGFTEIRTVEGGDNEFWSLEADLAGILKQEFSNKQALPPGTPEPRLDFYRAAHFHRFRGGDYDSPPEPPKPDFHEALGLLGGHPYLLRRLGLLIDVEVPFDGQAPSGKVLVAQVLHEPDWDDQSVSTNYLLDVPQRLFTAAPGPGSEISGGMLRLDSGDYDLVQVDVDGAALKAVQTANQLFFLHHGRRRSLDSTEDGSLPALRSSGIGVVRTGRAVNLAERLAAVGKANTDIKANTPPDLWADDLTRGYRVDVEDEGVWRSLCRRRATYRIGRLGGPAGLIEPDEDEGVVTAAVTQDVDKTRNELFLHENLFHWDGWSLAAPRPGEAIKTDGLSDKHEELLGADGKTRNPSQTSLELEVTSEPVAGSLPRLRFGRTYRLRARAVDVAGNSLPLSSNDDAEATPPITYKRYEPVEPPTVVIVSQKPLSGLPGDSATRPVIRTYNSTPAEDTVPSVETAERLLLPPRTAVEVIERYGHLDTPQGVDGSQQTWQLLADKDAAEIPEVIDNPADIPAEVPYLADPFAGAAVLRGLPGTPAGSLHVTSFDTAPEWWQGRPFRIATVEGSGPPIWHAGSRVLTVELPKATVTSVLLSSRIYPSDLDKLAVWEWIDEDAFDEDVRQHLRQLALEGCHWMLTPFRELTLVHAVQQPLAPPVIETLEPKKKLGNTFATLEGTVGVHGASTGKVDLLALWSEPTGHGFETADGSALVFDLPVAEPQATAVPWGGRRHEFGDTKHRRVNYYAVATTRFRDYFETEQSQLSAEELTRPRPEELPPHDNQQHIFTAEVLNSARPLAPSVLYVLPTFGWESDKDKRGVLSRRRGGLRIYLEEPWFSSGEGELLGVVVWPGRPDGCAGGTEPEGIGEAVEVPDKMKPYATQWGRDPIWLSGPTQQVPSLENFTRAVAIEAGLTLEERPPVPTPLKRADLVGVAGHQVGYDAERGLFFCDLDLDVGDTYFPFVRLALVRYQPRSVPSAELSRVVVADFAQFAPDRIARVAREPENPMRLGITVSGTGYRANASYNCTSDLEARLERWLGPSDGDLGWVPVSLDPIELENVQALETLALWRGSLELPDHLPGARFRVVIEEYESFLSDVPSLKLSPKDDDTFGSGRDRRLVYSDAVEIDTANSTP